MMIKQLTFYFIMRKAFRKGKIVSLFTPGPDTVIVSGVNRIVSRREQEKKYVDR